MPQRILTMDETVIASWAHKAMWGSGLTSITAAMADWNWTAIIAGAVTVGGFVVNWYYKHQRLKLEKAETAARIAAIKAQSSTGVLSP